MDLKPDALAIVRRCPTTQLKDVRDACRRLLTTDAVFTDYCAADLGLVEFVLWERRKHRRIMAQTAINTELASGDPSR